MFSTSVNKLETKENIMARITHLKRLSLILALVGIFILPGVAQARLMCRSDPAVVLSNGVILDIGATVSTWPWEVEEVHYELHIPVGVSMLVAIHTPTWLTSQETFTVIADQAPNQYKVATVANTSVGNATVIADATLVSALHIKLGTYSVSGIENSMLWLSFKSTH